MPVFRRFCRRAVCYGAYTKRQLRKRRCGMSVSVSSAASKFSARFCRPAQALLPPLMCWSAAQARQGTCAHFVFRLYYFTSRLCSLLSMTGGAFRARCRYGLAGKFIYAARCVFAALLSLLPDGVAWLAKLRGTRRTGHPKQQLPPCSVFLSGRNSMCGRHIYAAGWFAVGVYFQRRTLLLFYAAMF